MAARQEQFNNDMKKTKVTFKSQMFDFPAASAIESNN